jgi:hypothetical protein
MYVFYEILFSQYSILEPLPYRICMVVESGILLSSYPVELSYVMVLLLCSCAAVCAVCCESKVRGSVPAALLLFIITIYDFMGRKNKIIKKTLKFVIVAGVSSPETAQNTSKKSKNILPYSWFLCSVILFWFSQSQKYEYEIPNFKPFQENIECLLKTIAVDRVSWTANLRNALSHRWGNGFENQIVRWVFEGKISLKVYLKLTMADSCRRISDFCF